MRVNVQATSEAPSSKPLLHVLDYGEFQDHLPHTLWQEVLKGESDISISRAEIDLRKVMQALSFSTNTSINSFEALTALSLPGTTAALFWVVQILLQQKYPNPNLDNPIHSRNHDARLLFQQLAQLNLDPWYIHSVYRVTPDRLPAEIQFSPGHPIPGYLYRKHLLNTRQHCYYPINNYFSLLFEDRKKALLKLLKALGATKVSIAPLEQQNDSQAQEIHYEVIEFAAGYRGINHTFDDQEHPWLAYEPVWESVMHERREKRVPFIQFGFDIDVMGLLRTQIQMIGQLASEVGSIVLPRKYEEMFAAELLHPQRIKVEFRQL